MTTLKLYDYFRSSAAYRVRIALNLKGLEYAQVPVKLSAGAQRATDYFSVNPQGLVPTLAVDNENLGQSLAICEYLEECYPKPPLLPQTPAERARVRSLALMIACDIHPLNNLRVLNYLVTDLVVSESKKLDWYRHWVATGFSALEHRLAEDGPSGTFCHGDEPTLADCCLVPQVYNARRFGVDLTSFPIITRVDAACNEQPGFARAHPESQSNAV
jgi:maleylacetoacetate isomerase